MNKTFQNLFDVLSKSGYNKKEVMTRLNVNNAEMTVGDYMARYANGGLKVFPVHIRHRLVYMLGF